MKSKAITDSDLLKSKNHQPVGYALLRFRGFDFFTDNQQIGFYNENIPSREIQRGWFLKDKHRFQARHGCSYHGGG